MDNEKSPSPHPENDEPISFEAAAHEFLDDQDDRAERQRRGEDVPPLPVSSEGGLLFPEAAEPPDIPTVEEYEKIIAAAEERLRTARPGKDMELATKKLELARRELDELRRRR